MVHPPKNGVIALWHKHVIVISMCSWFPCVRDFHTVIAYRPQCDYSILGRMDHWRKNPLIKNILILGGSVMFERCPSDVFVMIWWKSSSWYRHENMCSWFPWDVLICQSIMLERLLSVAFVMSSFKLYGTHATHTHTHTHTHIHNLRHMQHTHTHVVILWWQSCSKDFHHMYSWYCD